MLVIDNICAFALIYTIYFIGCCIMIYQFSSFVAAIAFTFIQAFYYIVIQGGCISYSLIFNNHITQTILLPVYQLSQIFYHQIIIRYFSILNSLLEIEYIQTLLNLEIGFVSIAGAYLIYRFLSIFYAFYKLLGQKPITTEFFYNDECSFCFNSLNQQYDEIEVLKCKHAFHTSCMSKYIIFYNSSQSQYYKKEDSQMNCPICRSPLHPTDICGA